MLVLFCSCQGSDKNSDIRLSEDDLIEKGRVLAKSKCGSCHLFPEPNILDKETWISSVLPAMKQQIVQDIEKENNWNSWFIKDPSETLEREYESIVAFYRSNAPAALDLPAKDVPTSGIPGFSVETPVFDERMPNLATFISYDSISNKIWVGDRLNRIFGVNPHDFSIEQKIAVSSTPVQLQGRNSNQLEILTMGEMDPSDFYKGELISYNLSTKKSKVLIDSLNRPVHFITLNGLGVENKEWIISEFGNLNGSLSLNSKSNSESLIQLPGCRKSIQIDWDKDGDLDFIAGFGQAKEAIYWIENKGNGEFINHLLEEFHPAFGLSDLEVKDVNQDGYPDIILTNGDNADLSPILKPYHGVRIFLGKGNNELELNWFYTMPGAMSLVAEDFDRDGTVEMAVVSYFSDFRNEERIDWLYFDSLESENKNVYRLPSPLLGRWLTISSGDFDQDGDLDLLTGSFMFQPGIDYSTENGSWADPWIPFFILRNNLN